jgi:hypothetical protein
MRAAIKGALTVAALALAAACSDAATITAPDHPVAGKGKAAYPMVFTVVQEYSGGQPQGATGGTGVIDVAGTLQTPTPCYDVTAVNTVSRGTITVTVNAVQNGNMCIQVITWNNYNGQITTPAGDYTMRIVHAVNGHATTTWSGDVTVR